MKAGDKVEYGFFDAELTPGKDHIRVINAAFANGRQRAMNAIADRARRGSL